MSADKILLVILAILFWPIALPIYLAIKLPQWNRDAIGSRAENYVARRMTYLEQYGFRIANDILITSNGNTHTTQIDHVLVSNYGVFCIETKAHKGWIFGNSSQKYWKQVIYRERFQIYNPLWQNYAHTQALKSLLGLNLKGHAIESLIVFPNAGKIRVRGTNKVGGVEYILRYISEHAYHQLYTDEERDGMFNLITYASQDTQEARELHKNDVKMIQA